MDPRPEASVSIMKSIDLAQHVRGAPWRSARRSQGRVIAGAYLGADRS